MKNISDNLCVTVKNKIIRTLVGAEVKNKHL